jgi:MFS transporter, LPLT family, lysophospholipid transporter
MVKGFYGLVAAQFTSGLADNALLIVAMAYLTEQGWPAWWAPLLKFSFTLSYVVLAPWVGVWADRVPKGRLMGWMNGLKLCAAAAMGLGLHPLAAFALVGMGASVYAPAKYGLMTETVASTQLVKANGWLEVSLVLSILLGVAGGGALVAHAHNTALVSWWAGMPATQYAAAFIGVVAMYVASAVLTTWTPRSPAQRPHTTISVQALGRAFAQANTRLWRDPLGGVSLAATTLFWGAGATMQFAVLQWAQKHLGLTLPQAAYLQATVAIGVMVGAGVAAKRVGLRQAINGLPLGVALGLSLCAVAWLNTWQAAVPVLLMVGAMGGYLVVPMNALLQYRGQRLLSSGQSIAVQGFNENASVLLMLAAYALGLRLIPNVVHLMVAVGVALALSMGALWWATARMQDRPRSRQ